MDNLNLNTIYDFLGRYKSKGKKLTQPDFFQNVLPKSLVDEVFAGQNKSSISRYFNNKPDINGTLVKAENYLVENSSENWVKEVKKNLVGCYPAIVNQEFSDSLAKHLERINDESPDKYNTLFSRLRNMARTDAVQVAAILVLIGITCPAWVNGFPNEEQHGKLYNMLLPELNGMSLSDETEKNLKEMKKREEEFECSSSQYERCIEKGQYDYVIKACEEKLLPRNMLNDRTIGGYNFLLYKACAKKLEDGADEMLEEKKNDALQEAFIMGWHGAREEWEKLKRREILYRPESAKRKGAYCICNSVSYRSTLIQQTMQEKERMIVTDEFDKYLELEESLLFYLVDDDFNRNMVDCLRILQGIKDRGRDCHDVEIFVRGESKKLMTMIDTALNQMKDIVVQVQIIDENKLAAMELIAHHPLFYPIRNIGLDKNASLKFVVIGDSNCATWLIRMAYMLMQSNAAKNISYQIVLCSSHSSEVVTGLYCENPGMKEFEPEIKSMEIRNDCCDLEDKVKPFLEHALCYFAVAFEDDAKNQEIAVRLRELTIREKIERGDVQKLNDLAPIGFVCRDPYRSYLSHSLMVENEAHGERWFNNYCLIPFGSLADIYNYDGIGNSIIMQFAKATHLQYCQVNPENAKDKAEDELMSFYQRQYNRNSSESVAVGLPYRLFEYALLNGDKQRFSQWDILRPFFGTEANIEEMARNFEDLGQDKMESLAIYEHERWNRYMVSRGWVTATVEQVISYLKEENKKEDGYTRQQLYIARMHPCITKWDELDEMHRRLVDEAKFKRGGFKDTDRSNVRDTGVILRRTVLRKAGLL